jgi:replicative DNA helicase
MVLNRKNVVYFTTEMLHEQLALRFDGMFSNINLKDMKSNGTELIKALGTVKMGGGRLIIQQVGDTSSTVHLKALLENYRLREGFIPDCIVVDYADELVPTIRYREPHLSYAQIFADLKSLAMDLQIPLWTATQASNTAFELQRKGENLDIDNIGGARGKAHKASVVLSLVSIEKRSDHTGILQTFIIKNRSGMSSITSKYDVNYANMSLLLSTAQVSDAAIKRAESKQEEIVEEFKEFMGDEDEEEE